MRLVGILAIGLLATSVVHAQEKGSETEFEVLDNGIIDATPPSAREGYVPPDVPSDDILSRALRGETIKNVPDIEAMFAPPALEDVRVDEDGAVLLTGVRHEENGSVSIGGNMDGNLAMQIVTSPDGAMNMSIVFEDGTAILTARGQAQLAGVANGIVIFGDQIDVRVEAHTHYEGSQEQNQILTQARAETIVDVLASDYGVAANMTAVGMGGSAPLFRNKSPEAQALNERITFVGN